MPLPEEVELWVCPNCGGWYGSSMVGDLHSQWNEHHGVRTFRRSRCPNKACAEQNIHRVPIKVRLVAAP